MNLEIFVHEKGLSFAPKMALSLVDRRLVCYHHCVARVVDRRHMGLG